MAEPSITDEVWERRWQDGRIGFDQHAAHPSLVELLLGPKADELGIVKAGKAVVPGCGRGYDVHLLARRGLDAVGIDISPKGVEEAQKWLSAQETNDKDGKREVLAADFFEWAKGIFHPSPPVTRAVTVGGSTLRMLKSSFLCALPPDLRDTYITSLSTLARPASSTRLVTLMYPLLPPPHDLTQGPPFALSVDEYHRLLDARWTLIWSETVPKDKTRKTGASGGEMVGVWAWRT